MLKYFSAAQSLTSVSIGQELVRGSPWVSVNKRVLAVYEIGPELLAAERLLPQQRHVA